ncbi:EF-hand domain-containing protein [Sphaerotilus sp.]|uniref:EF-hand domain-containing protein n=1 Tax=Sphaerotilus sp. TaxID=2093942 RepID=UPI00286DF55F|nr:EF-hand domain-containing protein [Sphaerotilus sp.]
MTRNIRLSFASAALTSLALCVPALSVAQTPSPSPTPTPSTTAQQTPESAFKRADANADNKLSKEEAARMPAIAAKFNELDKDKDGSLSMEEFMAGNPK